MLLVLCVCFFIFHILLDLRVPLPLNPGPYWSYFISIWIICVCCFGRNCQVVKGWKLSDDKGRNDKTTSPFKQIFSCADKFANIVVFLLLFDPTTPTTYKRAIQAFVISSLPALPYCFAQTHRHDRQIRTSYKSHIRPVTSRHHLHFNIRYYIYIYIYVCTYMNKYIYRFARHQASEMLSISSFLDCFYHFPL